MTVLNTKALNTWVKIDETKTYGKFVAEPLAKGYGVTLGNSLRRILLSSLTGAAITSVKIEGVDHEFTAIEGINEDILDIILNLKGIVFKLHSVEKKIVHIRADKRGAVTAENIIFDSEVEVLNKDHYLATISGNTKLDVVLTLENGVGFQLLERSNETPIGTLPMDANFNPIVKVNHTVEDTRVGKHTDLDRLVLEVWTNGAISPSEAVSKAAVILINSFKLFTNEVEEKKEEGLAVVIEEIKPNAGLDLAIEDLELSARSSNCLRKAGIHSVAELVKKPMRDLMQIKNFGRKSADEINEKLSKYSLKLKEN